MSKKYYDKILSGSGTSSVKVKSAFGEKILAKYGWSEGQGLGSSMSGAQSCVQVERREDKVGIGAEKSSESSEWDNWWTGTYDTVARKINIKLKHTPEDSSVVKEKKKKKEIAVETADEEIVNSAKRHRVRRHVREE